jgi:hypothetical protein
MILRDRGHDGYPHSMFWWASYNTDIGVYRIWYCVTLYMMADTFQCHDVWCVILPLGVTEYDIAQRRTSCTALLVGLMCKWHFSISGWTILYCVARDMTVCALKYAVAWSVVSCDDRHNGIWRETWYHISTAMQLQYVLHNTASSVQYALRTSPVTVRDHIHVHSIHLHAHPQCGNIHLAQLPTGTPRCLHYSKSHKAEHNATP